MSEVKENAGVDLQERISSIEQFVEEKKQPLLIGGGILLVLIVLGVYVMVKWLPDRNLAAQKAMYTAEFNFAKDSFALALNGRTSATPGTSSFLGFAQIADKYSMTKSAKLANYYAGICCLNLKKFDDAIKYLDKFSTSDPIIGAVRLGAMGDAYMELGKTEDGLKYYTKAAEFSDNETYTPYFLFKAGRAYEKQKNYAEAAKLYERVRDNYPNSEEAKNIDAYVARATAAN